MTWLTMAANIMMSFPFLFLPMRISFLQLCRSMCLPGISTVEKLEPSTHVALTLGLMVPVVVAGICIDNLTNVLKVKGAICGMSVCLMLPAVMKICDVRKQNRLNG